MWISLVIVVDEIIKAYLLPGAIGARPRVALMCYKVKIHYGSYVC